MSRRYEMRTRSVQRNCCFVCSRERTSSSSDIAEMEMTADENAGWLMDSKQGKHDWWPFLVDVQCVSCILQKADTERES